MKLLERWRNGRIAAVLGLFLFICFSSATAANLGTVIPVVGRVADLAYDPNRDLVYLANITENVVNVYSVSSGGLVASPIPTGLAPNSLAISPDGQTLYVANTGSNSISVIDLNAQQKLSDITVSQRPDAVAVGFDGQILVLGPSGLIRIDPTSGQQFPMAVSVPAVPPGLPPITPSPVPGGTAFRAGLIASASGSIIVGLSTNRLFVYDVASGQVLRSRNVTGLLAILSIAPDGSRFMAGPFLFDTQTLAILGRTGTVSATLTGGSTFSIDGNTVYATFSTQPPVNPLNTNNPQNTGGAVLPGGARPPQPATQGVLQVLRASSLTPLQGLRLAEAINPKIVASPDGKYLLAISTSGLLVLPIGQLNQLPQLAVDTTNLVLSVNPCNVGIVTAQVRVTNLGTGRLTFAAVPANPAAAVIVNQGSGLAPSTIQISFNPRSVTTQGTQQVAIVLVSPEAVNIEPAILVNLNFADTSQRGQIIPYNGVAVDMQLDEARQRLYIANYTQDQIDIFSIPDQSFLPPIRVGNRPFSMSLANASTLVVANSGSEYLSVVDLDQLQVVQTVSMGPIPVNATPLFPKYVAASSNAVLFTTAPLPANPGTAPPNNSGAVWQLNPTTGTAFPRLNLGQGVTNVVQPFSRLLAPPNGSSISIFENNGTAVLYDPIADTFPVIRSAAVTGFRGTMSTAADGSTFLLDDSVFNGVLGFRGTLVTPATGTTAATTLTFGAAVAGNNAVRVQAATPPTVPVQSLQLINLTSLQTTQQFALPEAVMDITPAATVAANATRLWPPNRVAQEFGVNGQTQLLRRGVAVDSANNIYLLSISGLTIVPLTATPNRPPTFNSSGVVNSASFSAPVAPGSLISIFGSNLADSDQASSLPLPTLMGGVCITANATSIPLLYTSPTQINAQLPPNMAAGNVTLTVHSMSQGSVSPGVQARVNAAAPGVFSTDLNGQKWALLFHSKDFSLVTPDNPAHRDEVLVLYATGLGAVSPSVPSGQAGSASPLSVTTQSAQVQVGFSFYDVQFAGLAPGFVGVYQLNIYVPGDRDQGTDTSTCSAPIDGHCPLPVVVKISGASSATADPPLTIVH